MAQKKVTSTGSAGASVLKSGRETSSRKQTTSSSVNSRKSERIEKHTSPSPPPPVENELEKIEKQMVEIPKMKSTKEKTEKNSKQCSEDVNEDKITEKQDPDVGGRKRKKLTAIHYKASFKPQQQRIESDDDQGPKVEDKSPQANTSENEDVDKELKSQNSVRVQIAPDGDGKAERVITLDQIDVGDCPQTKSPDRDKQIDGSVSPSNRDIGTSDNQMFHTSSCRIEHDLENQQELNTCHKGGVFRKSKEACEKINREWDEKRASLKHDYVLDKCFIYALYHNPSIRSKKLKILEKEFANELKEHERLLEIRLEDLKATMLAAEAHVAADNDVSLHGSHSVAPTLPENPIEVQSHDEFGSNASEKEMIDATVSSELIGEVTAQQLDDDMDVDVAEKLDSSYEDANGGASSPDATHAVEDHNETGVIDMAPHVDSGDMETPAGNYNKANDEDGTVGLDTLHIVEDRCKTADDVAPEVEYAELETPAGACNKENAEDGEITPESNVDNMQPSSASQLDQIRPDNSSVDPTAFEIPSDTLPSSGPLLEPTREETTLTMPQSGQSLEVNLDAAAAEIPHDEHQPHLASSIAPAPPVNALDMFDNLINRVSSQMPSQTNPFQAEVERLYTVKENVTKFHQETKQRLILEYEKEIAESVSQIRLKFEAKHQEADAAYNSKTMELETNISKVILNRILAEAFRLKCQELNPSEHPVSQAGLMQQVRQSPPLLQPQLRLPVQIVHQPEALFSSTPSMPPSNTNFRPPSTTLSH